MKKIVRKFYLMQFSTLLAIIACTNIADAGQYPEVQPGKYDNTMLGFNKENNKITGFFSEKSENDSAPSASCEFYFSGTLTGPIVKLKIYQLSLRNGSTDGLLKIEKNGKNSSITMQLQEEQPGCINIYPKSELEKTNLILNSAENWIEIRIAAEKKVFFYKDSSLESKTKIYVTKGDVIGVLEYKDSWIKVAYVGERKTTVGWVKDSELYPSVEN